MYALGHTVLKYTEQKLTLSRVKHNLTIIVGNLKLLSLWYLIPKTNKKNTKEYKSELQLP